MTEVANCSETDAARRLACRRDPATGDVIPGGREE